MIPASLEVTVSPGFVSGSGATADFITTMLEAEGSDPENDGRVVDGLGDVGIVTSVVKFDAEAKFLQGDTLVADRPHRARTRRRSRTRSSSSPARSPSAFHERQGGRDDDTPRRA